MTTNISTSARNDLHAHAAPRGWRRHHRRAGGINWRTLLTLAAVMAVIGVGLVGLRQWRRATVARQARALADIAVQQGDWAAAARHLRIYLEKSPDDREALAQYGRAQLYVRPLTSANVGAAIGAYRRLLRLDRRNITAYEKLRLIYSETGNAGGLSYLAEQVLAQDPSNADARLTKARALLMQKRAADARQELDMLLTDARRAAVPDDAKVDAYGLISAIIAEDARADALAEARQWLDRAVELSPNAAKARLWRARFLRTHARQLGDEEQVAAVLRADLIQAATNPDPDPHVMLAVCEEWLALGELDKADAALTATETIDPEALERYYLDPSDWLAARFVLAADLALRRGVTADDGRLADEALAKLTERRQRGRVLPAAVELLAAAGLVDRATACLKEYRELLMLAGRNPAADERIALLEAVVARAAGHPQQVIASLEPLVTRAAARPPALKMLAEAYEAIGQPRRAVRFLDAYIGQVADPNALRRLARLNLDLNRAAPALAAAHRAEALDLGDLSAKLLRIEAELRLAEPTTTPADRNRLLSELNALRERHSDEPQVAVLLAAAALAAGDQLRAESELRRAETECRDPLPAVLLRARLRAADGGAPAAIEILQAACQRWPSRIEPLLAWVELEVSQGHYAQALALLEAAPGPADAVSGAQLALRRGWLLLRSGQQRDGWVTLKALADADSAPVVSRCGALALLLDEPETTTEQAGPLLEQLRTLEGVEHGLRWRFYQARLWLTDSTPPDRRRQAADLLQQCLQFDPGWEAPALLLGQLREQEGDLAGAEAIYRRALAENPTASSALGRLAALLERQGRLEDVLGVLDEFAPLPRRPAGLSVSELRIHAVDAGPVVPPPASAPGGFEPRLAATLARLSFRQDANLEQALRYLDAANTGGAEPWLLTATRVSLLRAAGQTKQARELLDALATDTPSLEAGLLRARYLVADGELTAAEATLRQLLESACDPRAYAALASFYVGRQRLTDARAVLEQGLVHFPQHHELSGQLAETLLAHATPADRPQLQQLLADLEQQRPGDPLVAVLRARVLALDGTPAALQAACDLLAGVVEVQPALLPAYLWLADYHTRLGDHGATRTWALRGLAAQPRQPELLLWQARSELALGNLALAGELARAVLSERPVDPEAAMLLAATAVKDPTARPEALAALARAAETHPLAEALRLTQARLLLADGQPEAAITLLEELRSANDGRASVACLLALANAYAAADRLAPAREALLTARRSQPNDPAVIDALVAWLAGRSEMTELHRLVDELCQQSDLPAEVLLRTARTMLDSSNRRLGELASDLLRRAIAQESAAYNVRGDAANLLYRAGAVESAIAAYQDLLAAQPDDARCLNDLAWILAEARQNYAAALELADRGLRHHPDDPDLLDTRGMILLNLPGRMAQARADFERCAAVLSRRAPGSAAQARALWQLGRVCFDLGDPSAARSAIREALEIDRRSSVFTADERPQVHRLLERLTQKQ